MALGFGVGTGLGIAPQASDGWETSASEAASAVLAPMLQPAALLGAAAFALAAVTLGWILVAHHIAVAALGALVWAAGLAALGGLVADGSLGERPLLAALGAAAALAVEHARRVRSRRSRPSAWPSPVLEVGRTRRSSRVPHAGVRTVS